MPLEIDVVSVHERLRDPATAPLMLDVREPEEWAAGRIPGAIHVPLGSVPTDAVAACFGDAPPDPDREIVCYCAAGVRSLMAADALRRMGFRNATSMAGGLQAWVYRGLSLSPHA